MISLKEVCVFILNATPEEINHLRLMIDLNGSQSATVESKKVAKSVPKKLDCGMVVDDLETLRKSKSLTRAALAELVEVSSLTIFNAERHAEKVSEDTIKKIKKVLADHK